jgi:hypothetical protein
MPVIYDVSLREEEQTRSLKKSFLVQCRIFKLKLTLARIEIDKANILKTMIIFY